MMPHGKQNIDTAQFQQYRSNMVQNQIIPSNVTNSYVLSALRKIPRHLFVEEHLAPIAYSESVLPIGETRFLLSPVMFGKMLEACDIAKSDKVLDLGCGYGYSTALISSLAAQVISIEPNQSLAKQAKHLLKRLGIANCTVHHNILSYGHHDDAPYDVIFVNGQLSKTDAEYLIQQLNHRGRLITIEDNEHNIPVVTLYTKYHHDIEKEEILTIFQHIPLEAVL